MNDYKSKLSTEKYTATVSESEYQAGLDAPVIVQVVTAEHYPGPYTVTPSTEAQTLETAGMHMMEDVTVGPIPSNYGRIAWNGVTLSVY